MQNLTILSSLALACVTSFVAAGSTGCLFDEKEDDVVCLAEVRAPLTITVHGTAARGRPTLEKLPNAECIEIEGPSAVCFFSGGPKEYSLTLRAEGYEPYAVKVAVPPSSEPCSGGYQAKTLEVTLVEAPSTT